MSSSPAEEAVARARSLVGTRFRPQGRTAEGLDCAGLAAAALGIEGVRADYALRSSDQRALEHALRALGLRPARCRQPGDLLVMRPGPGQLHLGIWTGSGLIHADAGLRRVVERPGDVPWTVVGTWRPRGGAGCDDAAPRASPREGRDEAWRRWS